MERDCALAAAAPLFYHRRCMRAYFQFVLRHRLLVAGACLALTALSAASLSRAVVSTSLEGLFFGQAPEYRRYRERIKDFASDDVLIFGYADPAPLSRASLDRLEAVVRRIERLPDAAHVESLLSAQRLWAEGETLRVESYARTARRPGAGGPSLLAELLADRQVRGTLVSDDGKHGAVIIEMAVDPNRAAEALPRLVADVQRIFADAGFPAGRVHSAGFPSLVAQIIEQSNRNLLRLFPLCGLALLGVVLLIFRRVAPALLAMGVSLLSVTWTMGFSIALSREINILMSMIPAVVFIVAFSDVIHLWNAYLVERGHGQDHQEALLRSAAEVGRACLLTSATTFVGFVCLSLIPTPAFRQMGVVLGFGVATALLLAMTLTPLVLSLLRQPDRAAPSLQAREGDLAGRALDLLARVASRHPGPILAAFALLTALCAVGAARINIDADMGQRLHPDNPYRRDQAFFERHFSGTNAVEIYVDVDREQGLLDPRLMGQVRALQRALQSRPEVDQAVSLVTLLEQMHQVLGGEGPLPATRAGLAQYLLLFEMSGGQGLERLVDFDRRSMLILLRLNDHGVRVTHAVGQAAERLGAQLLPAGARVEATGLVYLIGWWLDEIVRGQRRGLLLSCLVIALMMVLGLRSLGVGLGSMIPNLLPLLALGGFCGATMQRVDSDMVGMAMMVMGIGVDDTIHFLMRYRIEAERGVDVPTALRRTFAYSGRGIVFTTVVLVLGFLPFASSDYVPQIYMGTLLPGTLIVALLADLLLVPAMVRVGLLRYRGGHPGGRGSSNPS